MKKLIAFLLFLALAATILCGCSRQTQANGFSGKRFEVIHKQDYIWVYVDTETGVEWVWGDKTFVPIIDSYGNPYIYPAYDAREDRLPND